MADLAPTLREERRLWRDGHQWVAGLDEVGRGAWAGPVSVGVVIVKPGTRRFPAGLCDSKLLPEERREAIFERVARWCASWAVGHASPAECDRWGMTEALRAAAHRALDQLPFRPDAVLVDGPYDLLKRPVNPRTETSGIDPPSMPHCVPVVDGDAHCAAVAAASVLAKVVRDRLMRSTADHFPPYDFARNKGYPSPTHQTALRGYGLSAIHRRSWAFVDDLPWGPSWEGPTQEGLFPEVAVIDC